MFLLSKLCSFVLCVHIPQSKQLKQAELDEIDIDLDQLLDMDDDDTRRRWLKVSLQTNNSIRHTRSFFVTNTTILSDIQLSVRK